MFNMSAGPSWDDLGIEFLKAMCTGIPELIIPAAISLLAGPSEAGTMVLLIEISQQGET